MINQDNFYDLHIGPFQSFVSGPMGLTLEMDGEKIKRIQVNVGFSHKGCEKFLENRTYFQGLSYFDCMNMISPLTQSYTYILAIEKLLKTLPPFRAQYIRVIFSEISRIMNHFYLLGRIASHAGNKTCEPLIIDVREQFIKIIEYQSGSRIGSYYFRVGGVEKDLLNDVIENIHYTINSTRTILKILDKTLTTSLIFQRRTIGIGSISKQDAIDWSLSGPALRASGIPWDLRRSQAYEIYDRIDFKIPTGKNGDTYDRYLIYVAEIYESLSIIQQCLDLMPPGPIQNASHKIGPPPKSFIKTSLEAMIQHYKFYNEGFKVPQGQTYTSIESASGEFGVYVVSNGSPSPYRVKIRSSSFTIAQALDIFLRKQSLSDMSIILSSLGLNMGEIDR